MRMLCNQIFKALWARYMRTREPRDLEDAFDAEERSADKGSKELFHSALTNLKIWKSFTKAAKTNATDLADTLKSEIYWAPCSQNLEERLLALLRKCRDAEPPVLLPPKYNPGVRSEENYEILRQQLRADLASQSDPEEKSLGEFLEEENLRFFDPEVGTVVQSC